VSNSDRVAAIEALISECEDIQTALADVGEKIWDHRPMLAECEGPIGDATVGIDYLEGQKKEAIEEEADVAAGEGLSARPEEAAPQA
jgi:hypothetical protein